MADNDPQTTYVYKAKLVARSYFSRSYQSEEIELGTFSKETFATDAAVLKIKEGIFELYTILVEELQEIKEENLSSPNRKKETKGMEEVVEFLKETYNHSFGDNFNIKSINELIQSISTKLRDIEEFNFFEYIRQNDNSYFHPFFSIFYCSQSDDSEEGTFTLEIKEIVVDKFSSDKELPPTIK